MLGTYDANLYIHRIATLWMEEAALVYQLCSRNAEEIKVILWHVHSMTIFHCRNLRKSAKLWNESIYIFITKNTNWLGDVFHEEKTVGIHNHTQLSLCNKSSRNMSRCCSLIITSSCEKRSANQFNFCHVLSVSLPWIEELAYH